MSAPAGEKTEEATPTRVREMKSRGQVARSQDLPTAAVLVMTVALMPLLVERVAVSLRENVRTSLLGAATPDTGTALGVLAHGVLDATRGLAPVVLLVGLATAAANVAVSRAGPNSAVLKPRRDRMSPKSGIKKLVGVQVLVDLVRHSSKMMLLAVVAGVVGWQGMATLLSGPASLGTYAELTATAVQRLLVGSALVAVVVGVADAVWSRRKHNKTARMTKQEVRDDAKKTEGDPHTKAARRSVQLSISRSRMMAAVAGSDVVLANPTHVAVALTYHEGDAAPVVVARGAGVVARRMRELAAEHAVPVHVDVPLARGLHAACREGDAVPAAFWGAVAQVMAEVFRARRAGPRPADAPRHVPAQRRGGRRRPPAAAGAAPATPAARRRKETP